MHILSELYWGSWVGLYLVGLLLMLAFLIWIEQTSKGRRSTPESLVLFVVFWPVACCFIAWAVAVRLMERITKPRKGKP